MDIGYIWDEEKYAYVQRKHGVCFAEVVEVFEAERTLYEADPQGDYSRSMAVGETRGGKILQIIFTDEDAPLLRIITAFVASTEWEDEFKR